MFELLNGIRVIEGASFIAGPSCGLHLAQMGAEVIRFDQIGGGPDFQRWPLHTSGHSLYWEGLNKAKKSIALDLARPEGRELAVSLITAPGENSGLFVTNFPVKGFLSYEALAAKRQDLICLRVMGWADGTPAVDYTVNSTLGIPLMTGHADDARPVNHVLPAWDLLAGAYAAFSLLAAERERRIHGMGRHMRLALSDLAAATMGNLGQLAEVLQSGDRPRSGNDLFGAFGRDFVLKDGARIMVVAITPRQWTDLLSACALNEPVAMLEQDLGVSFAAEGERYTHRTRLFPLFERLFAQRSLAEIETIFRNTGVCWSIYQSLHDAVDDTRLFRGSPLFSAVPQPSGGEYPSPGAPVRILEEARVSTRGAPPLGENTDEVLAEVLRLSAAEIGRLHDAKLVAGPRHVA
jgi:2-methylfumaryl-CoA isomerase